MLWQLILLYVLLVIEVYINYKPLDSFTKCTVVAFPGKYGKSTNTSTLSGTFLRKILCYLLLGTMLRSQQIQIHLKL